MGAHDASVSCLSRNVTGPALLKKHHVEKVPVSDVCDQAQVQPNLLYIWQRQLFENAETALEGGRKGVSSREQALAARVAELEARLAKKDAALAKKDAVIAEISEEGSRSPTPIVALRGEPSRLCTWLMVRWGPLCRVRDDFVARITRSTD